MTNATIPAEQLAVLKDLSTAGDKTAGEMLSRFGDGSAPVKQPEPGKEEGNAPAHEGAPEGDPASKDGGSAAEGADAGVDPARPRNDDTTRKPSRMDTIRDLRRDRRQLREQNDAMRKQGDELSRQLAALNEKIKALENSGPRGGEAKEDDVVQLLSRPGEYLSEREKRLVESVQKAMDEKLQKLQAAIPGFLSERNVKDQARKILSETKDFDLDRDEDRLMELMEAKLGLEPEDIETLLRKRPVETAEKMRRVWEEAQKLSPQAAAAKAAAASPVPSAGGVKPKRTLEQLNQDFVNARTPQDRDRILAEIKELAG